ncbi:MAG: LysM peptidoglycan-binding domain-containing protein [Spirochaetaceae bacterium]|jgi:nucleoid-associated protein YgaU|nr:LysM peptidoglycan-binding domain-containing protein [Spirochaetaceae bacterium]
MKKRINLLFMVTLFCVQAAYSQAPDGQDTADAEPPAVETTENVPILPADEEQTIAYSLRRNKYFLESLRLKNLANLAIVDGEYEQSEEYSAEAVRNAELSDQYIAEQLKRQRALKAVSEARSHIAWAKTVEAPKFYPTEYERASDYFDAAITAQTAEDWDGALENSLLVAEALAGVAAPPGEDFNIDDMPKNPAKYTVRPWDKFGDCFWNIAYWFYHDYYKWPIIYEANKDKLPDRNNPDLVEVGTIIDIPPIDSEARIGMWDSGRLYKR